MAKYDVTIGGETFEVESAQPLSDAQAYNAALPEYTKLRAKQAAEEEAGRAAGGQYKIGAPGFKQAAEDVAKNTGVTGRTLQGVGGSFDRYALGLKGLFTGLEPEDRQRLEQNRILAQAGGAPATVGQIGGDIAITGPAMAAGGALAQAGRALPMALRAMRSLPGRVMSTVAPGAAAGALSSPEDRGTGALYGAAGGAAGAGINRAVGGALRPFISREGQELIEQGVQPTPGQAVGGRLGQMEEKLGSVPVIGDLIGRSRNRAIEEYNQALAGRVAQQVSGESGAPREAGKALGQTGDEALLNLRQKIGDVFDSVLGQVPQLRVEREPIERAVATIMNDPALALSDATAKRVADYAEKNLLARGADITGQTAARIESDLGKAAARYSTGTTGEERAYGEALSRLHEAWRAGVMKSLPSDEARAALQNAKAAWRGFVPLDQAAAAATSQLREAQGVFTPRVLRSALAKADKSQADNVLRTLQEQPVAQAASPFEYAASMSRAGRALGDVVPDSGTAGRLGAGGLVLGGGGLAAANPAIALKAAAGAGAAYLAYSRMGAKLLTQGVLPAQREAVATWLAKQGVPREAIPAAVQRTFELAGRTQAQSAPPHEGLRAALVSANR